MFRAGAALTAAIFLGLTGTAGADPLAAAPAAETRPAALTSVCKHYINRAKFKRRDETPEFVVTLADGCRAATRSLATGAPDEREAAAVFLARLTVLRDLVIEMNMTRVFGRAWTPVTHIGYGPSAKAEPVPRVSASGEYLIARELGLLAALNAWLDTGPDFALASPAGH